MEDVFPIGEKLKPLRVDKRYTQEGVAIELGVASSTYSDYERGVLNVPSAVVVRAAELYKVDLSYFYSLRGPVSITMNDQASNGYVEHQHSAPKELLDSIMEENRNRAKMLEDLIRNQLELLKQVMGKKK